MKTAFAGRVFRSVEGPAAGSDAGYWTRSWRRLRRNRLAVAGLAAVVLIALLGLAAPVLAPHDPASQDPLRAYEGPSWAHPMGLDGLGRDWLSRLVHGARVSIMVGVLAQAVVLLIGLPVGLIAGYAGGRLDNLLMRFTDLVYGFPDLLLLIVLRAVLGGDIFTLFLIIGAVSWMDTARLVRGQALALRESEFVLAARAMGATDTAVLARHVLPNALGPLIVVVTFGIPRAIFIEAALSFIGIGVDSSTPSWGTMVFEGWSAMYGAPHLVLFPSAAIALLMLAFTFLGDGLRDALDPRLITRQDRGAGAMPAPVILARPVEEPEDIPRAA